MRRGFRIGAWLLGVLLAVWAIGAGVITILISTPGTDIDGPVSLNNRILWSAIGVVMLLGGITALGVAGWRIVRILRSSAP